MQVLHEAERRANQVEERAAKAEKRAAEAERRLAGGAPAPTSPPAAAAAASAASAAAASGGTPKPAIAPAGGGARPAAASLSRLEGVINEFKVGARVLAVAPGGSDDEDGGADPTPKGDKWVPGRVLGERSQSNKKQYKISLDGYDSEDDAWVDADDPRVRPYEAGASMSGGGGEGADDKEERDRARKFNEQRKEEARTAHRAAGGER